MSEYDGHERYRDELARDHPAPPDAREQPVAWIIARLAGLCERILAFAIAITACYAIVSGICGRLNCASDGPGGLIFYAAGFLGGALAFGLFGALARACHGRPAARFGLAAAALAAVVLVLVLPLRQDLRAQEARRTESKAQIQAADADLKGRTQAWVEGLRAGGAHAPPGETPPQLRVEDHGTQVTVTNVAAEPLMVALARVRPDAAAPGGWRACGMFTAGNSGRGSRCHHYSLAPGTTATYELFGPCAAAFQDAPLEYRIGQPPQGAGWWSDSAFAAPGGREYADGK